MSNHHEWVEEVCREHDQEKSFAPENGQALKFQVGDKVIYTNEFGVTAKRVMTVTKLYKLPTLSSLYARGYRYLLDTDAHWMPVKEDQLELAVETAFV